MLRRWTGPNTVATKIFKQYFVIRFITNKPRKCDKYWTSSDQLTWYDKVTNPSQQHRVMSGPMRSQYTGHVITLNQSESIDNTGSVNWLKTPVAWKNEQKLILIWKNIYFTLYNLSYNDMIFNDNVNAYINMYADSKVIWRFMVSFSSRCISPSSWSRQRDAPPHAWR